MRCGPGTSTGAPLCARRSSTNRCFGRWGSRRDPPDRKRRARMARTRTARTRQPKPMGPGRPYRRHRSDYTRRALHAGDEPAGAWDRCTGRRIRRRTDQLFVNLRQQQGRKVAVSVGLFLERLAVMAQGAEPFGADGPAARALLSERNFTAEREAGARAMLDELEAFKPTPDAPQVTPEARRQSEDALWAWHLEWSAIARRDQEPQPTPPTRIQYPQGVADRDRGGGRGDVVRASGSACPRQRATR